MRAREKRTASWSVAARVPGLVGGLLATGLGLQAEEGPVGPPAPAGSTREVNVTCPRPSEVLELYHSVAGKWVLRPSEDVSRELASRCALAMKRPVGVVTRVQERGRTVDCSDRMMRERVNPRSLKLESSSMEKGLVICAGDTLLTWQGAVLEYRTFKPGGGWGEIGTLQELSRLKILDRSLELAEGRLSYFADPDDRERVVKLGRAGRSATFPGTYVEFQVDDTCTSEGTVAVPRQAAGAPGEVHGISICEVNASGELKCPEQARVKEGELREILSPERPVAKSYEGAAQVLEDAAQRYETQVKALEQEGVSIPVKDNDFEPGPALVRVTIQVEPTEAKVWLDGSQLRPVGGRVSVQAYPGPHVLLGRTPGFADATQVVEVLAGPARTVRFDARGEKRGLIEWIPIPSGTFQMGSNDGDSDERPVHPVTLSAFQISKTEVTVAQYRACVNANHPGCTTEGLSSWDTCNWDKPGRDDHPINCVDHTQATAFATWVGGSLPTEAQWEYAARGSAGRKYPWGDTPEPSCDRAVMNDCPGETQPVCSKEAGNTPEGLCDMAGNVWEWTADWYGPYEATAQTDPVGAGKGSSRVCRGGGWFNFGNGLRSAFRVSWSPDVRNNNLGFRVVRAVAPPVPR